MVKSKMTAQPKFMSTAQLICRVHEFGNHFTIDTVGGCRERIWCLHGFIWDVPDEPEANLIIFNQIEAHQKEVA